MDKCDFCGLKKDDVSLLISGLSGHICNSCVNQANEIVQSENMGSKIPETKKSTEPIKLLTPLEIKHKLDEYVIGQDDAKKVLSVAVYNHYKRLNSKIDTDGIEIEKSNILMVGETGTGKTLLAKTLAKTLEVPFCIADATVLTEAGYVGEDVESILSRLYQSANGDIEATEKGIIYIDEIDKIARKSGNPSITRDVSGEGVQQGLLKILEGTEAQIAPQGGRKHPDQKMVKINTANILFICGGAFDGVDKIVGNRINKNEVGYSNENLKVSDKSELLSHIIPADIKSFGLIPEIIGRLPVITALKHLSKNALKSIILEPKNALIKQYQKLMEMEGVNLKFDDKAIDIITNKAFDLKLGARGLRSILESIMTDIMFEAPNKKNKNKTITITETIAKDKLKHLKMIAA